MTKLDLHKLLTSYFNMQLNSFITTYEVSEEIGRNWTGGLMDVVKTKRHPYYGYAIDLKEVREVIFRESIGKGKVSPETANKVLDGLYTVYWRALRDNLELEELLLKPIRKLLISLCNDYKTEIFKEQINEIHLNNLPFNLTFLQRVLSVISPTKKKEYLQKEKIIQDKEIKRIWRL